MRIIIILLVGLILAGCDQVYPPRHLEIQHGEILFDNLTQECEGELYISYRLSADSELIVTCTQIGPIKNSLLSMSEKEEEK